MYVNLYNQITILWQDFNIGLALIIFLAYVISDGLYAQYTFDVTKYKPYASATTGALLHFVLAFGVLNYVHNFLYVVPIAVGSWIGTFLIVRREQQKRIHTYEK